ncbi:lipoate-protein ligase B [Candidatus Phycorickettsia trachydisci]|uniref:Octanoyltransferase n=1 Tax=Candidatus Phycorickettsia trachydisci TaxID=2115978 RepID=A0A2P1P7X2_9RICK|nr:lipoyl(octanoyl) transferase LipB [Candidatus Phycorickettsia trachydisci]AVP87361.1 lipoate-protein ligase B [Candidatus Phycorickettsia trachydisci]
MIEFITLPQYIDYNESISIMMDKVQDVLIHHDKIYVLLIEYSDLYTLGTSASDKDLLDVKDAQIYKAARGGQVTYHGSGQRVVYPILHLSHFNKDIKKYINFLGRVLIDSLNELGIETYLSDQNIGIWTKTTNEKVASIGIKVSKWVAHYGIAINISTDLSKFSKIIPCGINHPHQTSLHNFGIQISLPEFDQIFQSRFKNNFILY